MTYADTLAYLYNKLPMFTRVGSTAFKKDLTNTLELCKALGNPQNDLKTVHVAGTNGKGSVCHMLAAIFQSAGYKTGLYTSPHLYDFRERIRINGEMIAEEEVIRFTEIIKPLIERIQPSFFEITVAMAFHFFAKQKVDMAIIEVGLGGRLDSTNIIIPELSVITNIGWDHMNMLGNTLEEIAVEKAGIIKAGVPVIIGESLPSTKHIFEKTALDHQAAIQFADEVLQIAEIHTEENNLHLTYRTKEEKIIHVITDLQGRYQSKNVRTVFAAIPVLKKLGWKLDDESIQDALLHVMNTTSLQGRWEQVHKNPAVILEVAHNSNGIQEMLLHIQQLVYRQLHIVFGIVKDKDAASLLKLLPAEARYYFSAAHIPRALPAAELKKAAGHFSLNGAAYENVNLALQAALEAAAPDDVVIICGSIFLVAEVDRTKI